MPSPAPGLVELEPLFTDRSGLAPDGPPHAVVRARTVADVQRTLAEATRTGTPVVTRGAGTGLAGGAVAGRDAIVLDVSGLDRILDIDTADGIARVEPGVIAADLDRTAAEHGLMYAPDPGSVAICTVGGNVATNAGGLRGAKYGVTRDSVLALDVVLADGTLLHVGHDTVKGVVGLDLVSLFVGSEGTLGVVRRYDRARTDLSRLQTAVNEAVLGAPVIRSTGTAARARGKLDEVVDRSRDSLVRTLVPLHSNTSLGELAISTMTVAVLLGGVRWALAGDPPEPRLTAGQVVAMVFLVGFFVRPLQFLVQSLGEAQNALTGWRRALELMSTPSAEVAGGAVLPPGPVGVRVEQVSARYGDGPLVLRDVTARIAPGEHVAVVGRTGSGKSTFAKLLTRRLETAGGTIELGGVPLPRLAAASVAGRVVIVPQDPFLFDGTVGQNIRLGAPAVTDGDALRILHELGLADWFGTLPDGLATPVGLRGERLSVGERQLVALARTALADPDLVVLDEATSGVDPATDVVVQRALAVLTRDRTTVSIAHRMITAETADRVLVFAAGHVVQSGHHTELAGRPGPYADLVAAWHSTGGNP